ncbi:hypothetical protein LZG04_05525 [Saccharothrix sp. S26]|uniref:hypothetical protein n=1 Tax=Saccharothrix sp. S26 TaxID=2907215 RepID=UPI001F4071FA|nr:hypothetical protein [Saccharothrix sp. S26]MCE6994277.1 hypothetical protein [Saccharothrix sp. S26]
MHGPAPLFVTTNFPYRFPAPASVDSTAPANTAAVHRCATGASPLPTAAPDVTGTDDGGTDADSDDVPTTMVD